MDRIDGNLERLPTEWRPAFRRMLQEGAREDYDRDSSGRPASHEWTIAQSFRCLDDLYFLVTEVLYQTDIAKYGPFHKWMADTVGKTPGTRELWLLPRDHFKTTILTIGHAIQQILRNPSVCCLIVSRKDEMAHIMSDEMRRQFATNEWLRALFPQWCPPTMDEMGGKGEWMNPAYRVIKGRRRKEPTVIATGIKSTQQSLHYDWMYPDDCMDSADTTEVGLREIRSDFKELIPLASSDTGIIIPGTRKHYNDIYQAQMDTGAYKVYVRHGLEHPDKRCDLDECPQVADIPSTRRWSPRPMAVSCGGLTLPDAPG